MALGALGLPALPRARLALWISLGALGAGACARVGCSEQAKRRSAAAEDDGGLDDGDDDALWEELDLADEAGEAGEADAEDWEEEEDDEEQQQQLVPEQQQGGGQADEAMQRVQRQAQEGFARLAAKGFTGKGFGALEPAPAGAPASSGPRGFGSISAPAAGAGGSALRLFRCAAPRRAAETRRRRAAQRRDPGLAPAAQQQPPPAPARARRYAVDAPRVQRAIQDAGLQQRVVQVEELRLADAVIAVKLTPSGKHINLKQAQQTATNAGIPLIVAGRSMTGNNLLRSLQPVLSARSAAGAGGGGGKREA